MLVLDVSASMKTRSGIGTTRFDQALAEAAAIVDGLPRDGRMLVMTSGRKALLQDRLRIRPRRAAPGAGAGCAPATRSVGRAKRWRWRCR